MNRYAVTGSEDLSRIDAEAPGYAMACVACVLRDLEGDVSAWTTGGAEGVDSIAYYHGSSIFHLRPGAVHVIYPDGRHNASLVDAARERGEDVVRVLHEDPGSSAAYMARNDVLVRHADILLAFPAKREQRRSGTWATVRRARKAGVAVAVFPLYDGSPAWLETNGSTANVDRAYASVARYNRGRSVE